MTDDHLREKGRPNIGIEWGQCPDVESVPGRCGGAWVAKDSRVMVQGILDNAEAGCTAEEVADMFELPVEQVRRILEFARMTGVLPAPRLWGEEWLAALLLQMVVEHCAGYPPEAGAMMTSYLSGNATADDLDSYGIPANEDAMRELDGDLIEITHETDDRIFAKVTPQGRALLEQLQAEREDDPPGSTARAVKPSSANMIALHEDGAHILVTAEGCALLDRFHIEQQGGKAANWRHRPAR